MLFSDFSSRLLRRSLVGVCLTLPLAAHAQSAAPAPGGGGGHSESKAAPARSGETSENTGDPIIVNGNAVPGAVIGDIPPDNQLSPADIDSYGVSSVSELLDQLTEQTQSDQGRSSSGPVILVNGRRISGVNEIGDLPTESILRVDILPEEVALKYGYDAQQKVVNIILRRRFLSKVGRAKGQMATEGQGQQADGEFTYTRIHDNDRVNISAKASAAASLLESDRGILSTSSTTDPTGSFGDPGSYRTLKPSSRSYTLNSVVSHELSNKVTASFNAKASYSSSDSLLGMPSGTLTVPGSSPYSISGTDEEVNRYLTDRALGQSIDSAQLHAGASLNAELSSSWNLSVTGTYDHGDTRTGTDRGYNISALQSAVEASDPSVDPYGLLPSSLLGSVLRDHSTALSNSGAISALAMGKLFKLPAGDVRTSLRIGGDISALDSESTRSGLYNAQSFNRSEANAQLSLDIPLTSRKTGFLSAIGTLTANLNGSVRQISDYGTLGTFGYGLNWSPKSWVSIIASTNEDRVAPTLAQLNNPTVITTGVRVYDYVRGETATVTQISGGNPNLKADDRHVFKLGMTLKPLSKLTLTANYLNSRTNNAIGTLPSITAAIEAAFPDRFERDDNGQLYRIDISPVNFAREERQELRWGFTFTKVLRAPKRPTPPPGGWRAAFLRMQEAKQAQKAGANGQQGDETHAGANARQEEGKQPAGDEPGLVVNGKRPDTSDGPPPPDGFDGPPPGPPPEGMGPPPGDFAGGPPPGGPGGGPGGPGGPGGRGPGGGGRFGSSNGAQLMVSVYHSWYFRDRILLQEDGPTIDLLNGGASSSGGQPRHTVQFNAGVMDNGIGLRLSGTWKSATNVVVDPDIAEDRLHFSSLMTMDLRLFGNLANRFRGKAWARGTRVSLGVSNLFNKRQRVQDGTGATPVIYQPGYLDPYGRTISFSIRRVF